MASSLTLQRRSQRAAEESAAFGPIAERFRRAGDLDRAVSLCREGLQKFPHHISARVTLGWALLDQGKYDDARVELEQVMRRAPDNLAAIRGLAELHDRAEHTMNLPMDGPGQWPPDEQAVDHASSDAEPEIVVPASYEALETAAQFTADPADVDVEMPPESPAVFTAEPFEEPEIVVQAAGAPAAESELEAEADLEGLIAQATVAGVTAKTEVHADPVAYAEAVEDALTAEARTEVVVDDLVSETDIAALIAEAERLEAAAAAAADESAVFGADIEETVDAIGVAGNIELDAADEVELAAPIAEYEPEVVAQAVSEPVAEVVAEPIAEIAEPLAEIAEPLAEIAEPVAEIAEPVAEIPEPVAEIAEPVVEVVEEAVAEVVAFEPAVEVEEPATAAAEAAEPEIAEPETAEPETAETEIAEPETAEPEIAAAVAAEPEVEDELEPAAEVHVEPVAETPAPMPIAAFAAVERFEASVVDGVTIDEPVIAIALEQVVGRTHLAEIIPLARAARAESNGNTLVALERFLAKVQARRSELMAQSVA